MKLFPFFQDISGKRFLIVGSGSVAHEKAERLSLFTDNITMVGEYDPNHLNAADYCICATSDRQLNKEIAQQCTDRGIPVNVVDDAELCTFIFPALVKRGDLVIGISTQGTSPAYAGDLRRSIESELPDNIEDILEKMGHARQWLPDMISDQKTRKKAYRLMLTDLIQADGQLSEAEMKQIAGTFAYKDK